MSRLRYNRAEARRYLGAACPDLGGFIRRQGPLKLRVARERDLFTALSRAIVYQQLSGKAAATIHGRFASLFPASVPNPADALGIPLTRLRSAGLSQNKALSIHDLARRALDGSLPPQHRLYRMNDSNVVEALCQVRGIGPWTAQMVLIFNLGRPDVMPATDLGVQKGVHAVYRLDTLPAPQEVLDITGHLSPYRSAASWYFWRAADTVLMT